MCNFHRYLTTCKISTQSLDFFLRYYTYKNPTISWDEIIWEMTQKQEL